MQGFTISTNGIPKFTGRNIQSAHRFYVKTLKQFQPDERAKTIESMYTAISVRGFWMHNVTLEGSIIFRIDLSKVETDFQTLNIQTDATEQD
jgi:hypothetical protein